MTRESAELKARRMLPEGRLRVEFVKPGTVWASCRGDSGEVYSLGWDGSRWHCSCAAKTTCSHLRALMLVVVVDRHEAQQ